MSAVVVQEAAQDPFPGLPSAAAPAKPGEPGGPDNAYDTRVWRPDTIELYRVDTFDGYVTLQTASELFNVQRERLQMACMRGGLPAKKVPNRVGRPRLPKNGGTPNAIQGTWLVHLGDVARYLATVRPGRTQGPGKPAAATTQRQIEALILERQRLEETARAAEARAAAARAAREEIEAAHPEVTYAERRQLEGDLVPRERWSALKARNNRRLAADAKRRLDELQRAAVAAARSEGAGGREKTQD